MAKRESQPRQSGMPAPRLCLGGAADGGNERAGGAQRGGSRRWAGKPSGGLGGARQAEAGAGGKKAAHAGEAGAPGVCTGAGAPGKTRASRGFIRAYAGQKNGRRRGKAGHSGGQKAELAGAGGAKSPLFCPKRGGRRAVRVENWREKLAACVGLSGHVQGIFGRFRRKSCGLRKALSARI